MRERSVVGQGRGDDETEKLGAQHTDRRAFLRGLAAAALAVPLASLTVSRASTAHAAPANLVWTDRVHYDSGSGSSSSDSSSSSDEYDQNGSDDDDDAQNNREDEDERARRRAAEDELELLRAKEQELKQELASLNEEIGKLQNLHANSSDGFERFELERELGNHTTFFLPAIEEALHAVQLEIALLERVL